MLNVAINGFGRIGRALLRAIHESGYSDRVRVVAINDLAPLATSAHLLAFDSVHGRFSCTVEHKDEALIVNGQHIRYCAEADPRQLPWEAAGVDIVLECSGRFRHREEAALHLEAGADKVLISAPGDAVDATIVYGVNHDSLNAAHRVVSNASCTTNCLAPVLAVLEKDVGIVQGAMTTVHAYTNDQNLQDAPHEDLSRARAAALSMIPTKTGAASAIGLVLPSLEGKLHGMAVRVPTANVSLLDLHLLMQRPVSTAEINDLFRQAAASSPVLACSDLPLVSVDYNHQSASATVDTRYTKAQDRMLKVMAWYDNEWAFAHRMLDTALCMGPDQG